MNQFIKTLFATVLTLLGLVMFPRRVDAQVINEMSTNTSSDWVEIYNEDVSDLDLSGYYLRDVAGNTKNLAGTLVSNGFLAFDWSNRLDNGGDMVTLFGPGDIPLETIPYGDKGGVCLPTDTGSIGRYPDANSTIERFVSSTKSSSNNSNTLAPCPTPTSSPANTPTSTPKPTKTATPTSTPKPTKTATPTPRNTTKPKVTVMEDNPDDQREILGTKDKSEPTATPTPEPEKKSANPVSYLLIFFGVGFLGAAGAPFIKEALAKRKQKGEDKKDEEIN